MASQPPVAGEPGFVPPEPETEFHISQWLELVRRRRKLIAVVAAAVVAASLVLYAITPRVFRAATVIQIERRSGTNLALGQGGVQIDDWVDAQSFYPTQYRLLQSRGIAERVVKNLRLIDDPVFNPGRAALLRSSTNVAATADTDAIALGGMAGRLLGGIEVNPIRATRLVEVAYTSTNPELAARIANGIADAFIDWGVETRFATVGRASSFLASQIETIKQEIQDKEAQLQAYSRRTDIVALDPSSNVTLQRLEGLNKDYVNAVSERISKEARYNELTSSPDDSVADTFSGGLIGQLRGDQMKLERDYATKLNTYKPDWPAMLELKAQIDKGRQHLAEATQEMVVKARETAKAEYQGALRREESLTSELTRQKSDAMQLNSAAVEYNNLKVEVSTRRTLLDELVKRQSETEVTARLQGTRDSNVLVVDRALVPRGPYRPSLSRNLSLGLFFGLGIGLGVAFFLEYLDRSLKTPDDVERVLGLPLLAVIPDVSSGSDGYGYARTYYGRGSGSSHSAGPPRRVYAEGVASPLPQGVRIELLPQSMPRLAVSEAYRALRTALLLSTANGLKSVVVSSAIPGEGKTAISANLAVVLAQLGKQVLLVDADLRKPRLHEVFGVPNRVGLVSYLTGSAEEDTVILPTQIPNLSFTPSGPMPPNSSELLSSERMLDFVAKAYQRFDYVVLDSPPALPVTDATVLAAMADGLVLCIGAGMVLREDARACRQRFQLAEIRVLGVALNFYRERRGRYGKRYRSYEAYVKQTAPGKDAKA
ncbi:MAG: polysaccharide biosynthesis tyrosine autokinase [Acidobacteriia bacterium]|nr:polysaccharide biosynthesis tyrosine autokinase [Terriglobia bacterium]